MQMLQMLLSNVPCRSREQANVDDDHDDDDDDERG
jgi:hypothetical protein